MSEEKLTVERVQQMITRGPYHQWLGLKVLALGEDSIEISATWREEWVVNPDRRYTHGGVLAALVDLTADWALVSKMGRPAPTIDMRFDYQRAPMPGDGDRLTLHSVEQLAKTVLSLNRSNRDHGQRSLKLANLYSIDKSNPIFRTTIHSASS